MQIVQILNEATGRFKPCLFFFIQSQMNDIVIA